MQSLSPTFVSNNVKFNHAAMLFGNCNNFSIETNVKDDTHVEFLKQYKYCFSDFLSNELPPLSGEDNHMIKIDSR